MKAIKTSVMRVYSWCIKARRTPVTKRSGSLLLYRMTTHCGSGCVKWFIFSLLLCQVLPLPQALNNGNPVIKEIFSGSKREISSPGGPAVVPLFKTPVFNPFMMYPPVVPAKPFFYPSLMNPDDSLLGRTTKQTTSTVTSKSSPFEASDPSLISTYFKSKKDEFLTKLFERLMKSNATTLATPVPEKSTRSASLENETAPVMDPSFFLKKKFSFLETLFKTLNATSAAPIEVNSTDSEDGVTTPKPTIVPPDFWFPFPKLAKTPKPPKPTKPPKAKKVLKDALDTILLQSLLFDLGVDPQEAAIKKRAVADITLPKQTKVKKAKEKGSPSKLYIPEKVNPNLFSTKATECLNKLFMILNKTGTEDGETFVKPKATVIPMNLWTKPSEVEYASKLDAFLDLLLKSLNVTETTPDTFGKFKSKPNKKLTRSTFLDELLHRVTTTPPPPPPTTTMSPGDDSEECKIIKELLKECFFDEEISTSSETSAKSQRSLIFRPFGSGYWVPQYLYAAKMGMYLDKLMDSINTAAVSDVESSSIMKRSLESLPDDDLTGLSPKEAAIKLIIAELSILKDDLIDAFSDGIKAQKDATPTGKPYGPASKSFKKPFWGGKAMPTADPIVPIQKRIDVLNDVFDKLTKVEKTLMFTSEPEYDPKLLTNLTEILDLTAPKTKLAYSKKAALKPTENPESPEYFLTKTKEYLQSLYGNKMTESDDK